MDRAGGSIYLEVVDKTCMLASEELLGIDAMYGSQSSLLSPNNLLISSNVSTSAPISRSDGFTEKSSFRNGKLYVSCISWSTETFRTNSLGTIG